MKFEITINPRFNTKEHIASALEDLALQINGSTQDPATASAGAGYMGVYCGHATVKPFPAYRPVEIDNRQIERDAMDCDGNFPDANFDEFCR